MSSYNCNECGTAIIDTDNGYVTACDHWPMDRNRITTDVSNKPFVMDGLALQSPTPEQIDTDIIGELSKFRQKIAVLETAKEFNAHIHDNIIDRLCNLENKSQFRFAEGYHKGREAILRTNQSGCCCIVNDSDEIVSVCGAHEQWGDNLLKKLKTIENQFLEILSHGCCIPACSKHRGAIEG